MRVSTLLRPVTPLAMTMERPLAHFLCPCSVASCLQSSFSLCSSSLKVNCHLAIFCSCLRKTACTSISTRHSKCRHIWHSSVQHSRCQSLALVQCKHCQLTLSMLNSHAAYRGRCAAPPSAPTARGCSTRAKLAATRAPWRAPQRRQHLRLQQ
jgi:hypothetical protein